MKKLKLFPKIFIYTLALLLLITMLASGTIYLLAPMMGENSVYIDQAALTAAGVDLDAETHRHPALAELRSRVSVCRSA